MDLATIAKELGNATSTGDGYICNCPAHDDHDPSLSIKEGSNGILLVHCFAGCAHMEILKELRRRNLLLDKKGLTVRQLAEGKQLDPEFLKGFGVTDVKYSGLPAVKIPYNETQWRYRISLNGNDKFRWKKGAKVCLYGLEWVDPKEYNEVFLVEGESDCWTLWNYDYPVIGIPGANNYNDSRDSQHLLKYEKLYVVQEPDQGGFNLIRSLLQSSVRDKVYVIRLDGFKDVSDLHIDSPRKFNQIFLQAIKKSEPLQNISTEDIPLDPIVEEMNKKHAVIMISGKCCILNEVIDPAFNRPGVTFSSKSDLKNYYANQIVQDPKTNRMVGKADYWFNHRDRRQYDGLVFLPGDTRPGYYNLWKGWAVKPRKGNCKKFLHHIRDNIAKGNRKIYDYILYWLADLFQNPAHKPGTAIVLRGKQGTGKGVFASQILKLVGQHGLHLSHQKRIVSGFNDHLKDSLLAFLDEAIWAGDKSGEGALKALVTEDQLIIEPKGVNPFMVRNFVRLIIASNNDWVCPAGMEERRFFVIDVGTNKMQDSEYFGMIVKQMDNGGREAFLHYLLNIDLSGVNLRLFPTTDALLEQKVYSMSPVEKFWFDVLTYGVIEIESRDGEKNWDWVDDNGEISTSDLHKAFVQFSGRVGHRHRATSTELGTGLKKIVPELEKFRRRSGHKRSYYYRFSSLMDCRKYFETRMRQTISWPDEKDV